MESSSRGGMKTRPPALKRSVSMRLLSQRSSRPSEWDGDTFRKALRQFAMREMEQKRLVAKRGAFEKEVIKNDHVIEVITRFFDETGMAVFKRIDSFLQ